MCAGRPHLALWITVAWTAVVVAAPESLQQSVHCDILSESEGLHEHQDFYLLTIRDRPPCT